MKMKRTLFALLFILLITLASCSYLPGKSDPSKTDYYKGSEGVRMRFTDAGNPPARMYYFADDTPENNAFNIFIDVHNVGASYTKGGLYVSGYDPSMIQIEEIDIPRLGGGS